MIFQSLCNILRVYDLDVNSTTSLCLPKSLLWMPPCGLHLYGVPIVLLCTVLSLMNFCPTINNLFKSKQNILHTDSTMTYVITATLILCNCDKLNMPSRLFMSQLELQNTYMLLIQIQVSTNKIQIIIWETKEFGFKKWRSFKTSSPRNKHTTPCLSYRRHLSARQSAWHPNIKILYLTSNISTCLFKK